MNKINAFTRLSKELETWCLENGFPYTDALKLLMGFAQQMTAAQRHWLNDYITRWNHEIEGVN